MENKYSRAGIRTQGDVINATLELIKRREGNSDELKMLVSLLQDNTEMQIEMLMVCAAIFAMSADLAGTVIHMALAIQDTLDKRIRG